MSDRPPPVQQAVLSFCMSCADETDATLCCARCRTLYCSRACQQTDWSSGGHKKACKGIARARRDTNLDTQSRALARVAHMSGGSPDEACCLFCLDRGDAADPLMRGCACRGSAGWTHMGCLIKSAETARAPPPPAPHFAPWLSCSTCKQAFTGLVMLRLAIALWMKYARAVETNMERRQAAALYATALGAAGEHAEAVRLKRGILDVCARTFGPEHHQTLTCATNLARSLSQLGEHAEAAALLRTTLAAHTRTDGSDDNGALAIESHLSNALHGLGEYAEAEACCRRMLEKERHILGPDHRDTLVVSANLASSLSHQGKHAEAVQIQREVVVSTTRLLGAEHEQTISSMNNLAASLLRCGLKAEAEQLIIDTLPLSRHTLGTTHELTLNLLLLRALV